MIIRSEQKKTNKVFIYKKKKKKKSGVNLVGGERQGGVQALGLKMSRTSCYFSFIQHVFLIEFFES